MTLSNPLSTHTGIMVTALWRTGHTESSWGQTDCPLLTRNGDGGGYYETPTFLNFFTGVGGTYYPARSLDMEVYNADVFQDICPFADDVWFNAMAVKNGTRTVRAQAVNPCGEDYIENIEVQNAALCKLNVDHGLNDRQLRAVLGKYNLYGTLADEYRRVCQENVKKF